MNFFWQKYTEIPVVTRILTTSMVLMSLCVNLKLISPLKLYFNPKLILQSGEIWRLLTPFFVSPHMNVVFLCDVAMMYQNLKVLEVGPYDKRAADFFFVILFGMLLLDLFATVYNPLFLLDSWYNLVICMFCQEYYFLRFTFLGYDVRIYHLPQLMLVMNLIFGSYESVMGIIAGYVCYFLDNVYPTLPGGSRILEAPWFIRFLFQHVDEEEDDESSNAEAVHDDALLDW